jgi:hypothetical protein
MSIADKILLHHSILCRNLSYVTLIYARRICIRSRVVDPNSFKSGSSLFSQSGSGLDQVLDSVWIWIWIWILQNFLQDPDP